MSEITITNTRPEHLAALAEHQRICFPTLAPDEWMTEEHFASHLRLFPEGQHVALDGERLYGSDMSVHPAYRGRKISRLLYDARKDLARRLRLRGIVAGGMIPGYKNYRDRMNVAEYANAVASGELIDPTLTPQLRAGFRLRGILYDYIDAGELGNDSTLIVWENLDWHDDKVTG